MFSSCQKNLPRIFFIFYFSFFLCGSVYSQGNFKPDISLNKLETFSDSISSQPYNKKRLRLVTVANIIGYGGSLIVLNNAWYSKEQRTSFHFFNDDAQWLQMDKAGHVYSAYVESNASMEMWKWTGLNERKAAWIGALSGTAYQCIIEILDGFSPAYGFSVGDLSANILGSSAFLSQQLLWGDQKIKLKFSYRKKDYQEPELIARANDLYGKTNVERFIKDYNAQTYWLTANIHSFFPETKLPRWLNISVGYGAEGMFGGRKNIAVDETGNVVFERMDIQRYRQWFLAPDVDLTRIKTNKKGVKVLLFFLNSFKFPAPALEFSNGNFKAHWIAF